ncbi:MAG: hypothetical protein QOJ42_1588 [Acidobacteriaceae bacterium]|nr:hypothetical protein [Acidobacteriaceae bacterium]
MRARRLVRHVPKRSMTRAHSRKRLPINQMSAIDDARDCGGADAGLARYFIESRMFSFLDHCISTEDGSENEGLSLRCVRGNVQQLFGAEANVSCKAVQQYGLDQIAKGRIEQVSHHVRSVKEAGEKNVSSLVASSAGSIYRRFGEGLLAVEGRAALSLCTSFWSISRGDGTPAGACIWIVADVIDLDSVSALPGQMAWISPRFARIDFKRRQHGLQRPPGFPLPASRLWPNCERL